LVKIQRIKQKNDLMQKQIGSEIEDSIKDEINRQKEYLEVNFKRLRKKSTN
jgi:hypothetical protein